MGILAGEPVPDWHPAPPPVRQAGVAFAQACKRHGLAPAAVALQFCIQHPFVSSTLIGMSSPAHVTENLRALNLEVPEDLRAELDAILAPVRNMTWASGQTASVTRR